MKIKTWTMFLRDEPSYILDVSKLDVKMEELNLCILEQIYGDFLKDHYEKFEEEIRQRKKK